MNYGIQPLQKVDGPFIWLHATAENALVAGKSLSAEKNVDVTVFQILGTVKRESQWQPNEPGTGSNGGRAGSAGEASNASACGGGGSGGEPTWQSGAVCGVGQPPTLLGSLEREYQHGREDALQEFADWQPTPEQAHEAVRIYKEITATCKNDSDWEQKPIGLRWLTAWQRVCAEMGETK